MKCKFKYAAVDGVKPDDKLSLPPERDAAGFDLRTRRTVTNTAKHSVRYYNNTSARAQPSTATFYS